MNCDSKKCEDAGKICDALGIQFIADIEIEENKETLPMRIDKDQRIKNQQMKFYADVESFEEEMTKRGPWMKKHYYVMGQVCSEHFNPKETCPNQNSVIN